MDILITEELASSAFKRLEAQYQLSYRIDLWKDAESLKEAIASARVVLVRNQTRISREIVERAPRLWMIGRLGVGLDNIDLKAASERGIVVVAPLGANAVSVAEFTMGLILSLARKLPEAVESTREGKWERSNFMGVELAGKRLAVVGFGRIGQLVAKRARAFEMQLDVFDPILSSEQKSGGEPGMSWHSSLDAAISQADFVSVHVPLLKETAHLFNHERFSRMKKGACFINTSRGAIVDESSLIHALASGQLGGAALDVREVEPPSARAELETMNQVLLTPHIAAFTREAQQRTFEAVAADAANILSGKPAENYVNFPQPRR